MQTWAPIVTIVLSVAGAALALMKAMFKVGGQLEERFGTYLTKDEHSHICQRNQEEILERISDLKSAVSMNEQHAREDREAMKATVQQLSVRVAVLTDRSDDR